MTERLQRELETLPVAALVKPLNETLRRETAAIVTAAPGAGKSTVLPLTILEGQREGTGKIVVGTKTCGGTANRLTYGVASWRVGGRDRGLPHPV